VIRYDGSWRRPRSKEQALVVLLCCHRYGKQPQLKLMLLLLLILSLKGNSVYTVLIYRQLKYIFTFRTFPPSEGMNQLVYMVKLSEQFEGNPTLLTTYSRLSSCLSRIKKMSPRNGEEGRNDVDSVPLPPNAADCLSRRTRVLSN